tara:strand:+ start:2680 stop:2874 length:195 start_codon:yes stop_codon:yes gene_type:complete
MKTYNITLNEKQKKCLEHFMEKHVSIFNNLLKVRDNENDKKEKDLRVSILNAFVRAETVQGGKQ